MFSERGNEDSRFPAAAATQEAASNRSSADVADSQATKASNHLHHLSKLGQDCLAAASSAAVQLWLLASGIVSSLYESKLLDMEYMDLWGSSQKNISYKSKHMKVESANRIQICSVIP